MGRLHPVDETMAALDSFVRSGKVRYVGCSNFTAAQIVESQWAAQRSGGTPFISSQSQYSLLARSIEAEILPTCRQHGIGTRIGRLRASPMPAARSWATRQPGVTAVIIGPRTLGQLQDNLAGFSAVLPPDVMTRLSEISGPPHAEPVTGMGAHR